MTKSKIQRSWTIGSIAEELGEPIHRIQYILKSRSIEPSGIAGNCRLFTEADVERIAAEINRIDEAKAKDATAKWAMQCKATRME